MGRLRKNHYSSAIEWGWDCTGQREKTKIIRTNEMELLEVDGK